MAVFRSNNETRQLMRQEVSLDEILHEEKRLVSPLTTTRKFAAKRSIKRQIHERPPIRSLTFAGHHNRRDAATSPAASALVLPKPSSEIEASALVAYYAAYMNGLKSKRMQQHQLTKVVCWNKRVQEGKAETAKYPYATTAGSRPQNPKRCSAICQFVPATTVNDNDDPELEYVGDRLCGDMPPPARPVISTALKPIDISDEEQEDDAMV